MAKLNPFEKANKLINEQFFFNTVAYHRQYSADMLGEIAIDTPVKDGHATGNWHISIDKENLVDIGEVDKTISAIKTYRRALAAVEGSKNPGSVIYINNAVQGREDVGNLLKSGKRSTKRFTKTKTGEGYIIGLEHGKSKQAPNGMVLLNVVMAQKISRRALKRSQK